MRHPLISKVGLLMAPERLPSCFSDEGAQELAPVPRCDPAPDRPAASRLRAFAAVVRRYAEARAAERRNSQVIAW